MITPRRTRLLRVPSLRGMQDVLTGMVSALDLATAGDTFVVVPTRAAGEQLRRTVEDRLRSSPVVAWPRVGPRADLYRDLAARTPGAPPGLSEFDREVLLARLAREVTERGLDPPFAVRPSLVAEMLALYDHIRRQARTLGDFDRNLSAELESAADTDRGAAQLLRQTAFLSAVFAAYEQYLAGIVAGDEHVLRARLLTSEPANPLRHVVVTVADRAGDAEGLWPVDFTLLAQLPGLDRLDVIATEALLGSGFLERVHAALPGLDEVLDAGAPGEGSPEAGGPRLMVPAVETPVAVARDREEELAAVARRIKAARRAGSRTPLSRQALIVRKPLPYLYVARSVFGGAGVPFEALDTLPLAAEPFAAALDLVLDAVATSFSRAALVGLLRSPHFGFDDPAGSLPASAIGALDRALAEARYLGGLDRLVGLSESWNDPAAQAGRAGRRRRLALPALAAALGVAAELAPLGEQGPVLEQLARVTVFLSRHHRSTPHDPDPERSARVRGAVLGALAALGAAYNAYDADATMTGSDLSFTIRRWLGGQTFAVRTGRSGVRLLDAQAARFADVDEAQILGLVEGEWPEPSRRNIFYPPALLGVLDPAPAADDPNQRESEARGAARAAFGDLMRLPRERVRASSFSLEFDAIVEPSPFVDDLGALGLAIEVAPAPRPALVFAAEALTADPPVLDAVPALARAWAALRKDRPAARDRRFMGEAGPWTMPRVSVSRVDRYLKCPFQFFASEVLGLEEEPEDADLPPPWERGRFLHAIFETFFREWQQRGHRQITPADVPVARALLEDVCERALAGLPDHEAALERPRLHGSAASAGIIDRVLAMEAERPATIQQRLVEFELDALYTLRASATETRDVRLRAKVDRVDLLAGDGFRVIDYKSRFVPDPKRSVQLQIYTAAIRQQLDRAGSPRQPVEAFYLSLEGEAPVKHLRPAKGQSLDDVLADAEQRMVQVLDDIAAGHFPARPSPPSLCAQCPFDAVCRKQFVEPDDA